MPWYTIAVALTVVAAWVLCWLGIFRKAGFATWQGLLAVAPVVAGFVVALWDLLVFVGVAAFLLPLLIVCLEWPVRRQVRALKVAQGVATDDEAYGCISDAARLEKKGSWEQAMATYKLVADKCADRPPGRDALNYIVDLEKKMGIFRPEAGS
ncbi:MAG: hypothetical protein AMJ81_03700 [Phycisphaerae bacterium SM23_33]|nr:MAG: hypothetical protein AMJ81_03700 [Phycisphaerae bacterium SM23_33]